MAEPVAPSVICKEETLKTEEPWLHTVKKDSVKDECLEGPCFVVVKAEIPDASTSDADATFEEEPLKSEDDTEPLNDECLEGPCFVAIKSEVPDASTWDADATTGTYEEELLQREEASLQDIAKEPMIEEFFENACFTAIKSESHIGEGGATSVPLETDELWSQDEKKELMNNDCLESPSFVATGSKHRTKERNAFHDYVCTEGESRSTTDKAREPINQHKTGASDNLKIGTKYFACMHCNKTFYCKTNLQSHMRMHFGIKPYECIDCRMPFVSIRSLVHHSRVCPTLGRVREAQQPFRCSYCNLVFTKTNLFRHLPQHQLRFCYACGMCFKSKTERDIHCKTNSCGKTLQIFFRCNGCGDTFSSQPLLNSHVSSNDTCTQLSQYQCSDCCDRFQTASTFRKHLLTHELPFKCPDCPKRFKKKRGLTTHLTSHLTNAKGECNKKQYTCHICGRSFKHNQVLSNHIRSHRRTTIVYIPDRTVTGDIDEHHDSTDERKVLSCSVLTDNLNTSLDFHPQENCDKKPPCLLREDI